MQKLNTKIKRDIVLTIFALTWFALVEFYIPKSIMDYTVRRNYIFVLTFIVTSIMWNWPILPLIVYLYKKNTLLLKLKLIIISIIGFIVAFNEYQIDCKIQNWESLTEEARQLNSECLYPQALSCAKNAYKIADKVFPADHFKRGISLNWLGTVYFNMGDFNKSRDFFYKTIKIWEKEIKKKNFTVMQPYNFLIDMAQSENDNIEVERLYIKVLELEGRKEKKIIYLNKLITFYEKLERFNEANEVKKNLDEQMVAS